MHLSSHNKASNRLLLIANGHEVYLQDLLSLSDDVHFIDPYFDSQSCVSSNSLKSYLDKNNIQINDTKIVYASGLEGKDHIHKYLDENFQILGNPLFKFQKLSDIYKIDKKLFNNHIITPKFAKSYNYKYLSKTPYSSGGVGVGNSICPHTKYFQEFIPGSTYSVSFIAVYSEPKILGFNQLFTVRDNIKYPYLNAGAMMIDFDHKIRINFENWLYEFCQHYRLSGYASIDFKVYKNRIYILDINPRLSGTYRLHRRKYGNLMLNHLMYTDKLSKMSDDYFAYIILYAKGDIIINQKIRDIPDISDSPEIDAVIKKNSPILTLNIKASNQTALHKEINQRIMCAMKIIDCYNTQLDYEQY